MCFTYQTYAEQVIVKVTPGVPAQLKLLSEPQKVRQSFYCGALVTYFLISHPSLLVSSLLTFENKILNILKK